MKRTTTILILLLTLGCQDLDVDNLNESNILEFSEAEILDISRNASVNMYKTILSYRGVVFDFMTDQITHDHTHRYYVYTEDKPVPPLVNSTGSDPRLSSDISYLWNGIYAAIGQANDVLRAADRLNPSETVNRAITLAKFIRGIGYGYIGLTYDRGFIFELDEDYTTLQLSSYEELIIKAVDELEIARDEALALDGFFFDHITDSNLNAAQFSQLCNSYMAKFLMGMARDSNEFSNYDFEKIRQLAMQGIEVDWSPTSNAKIWNGPHSYNAFQYGHENRFFAYTDLKVINLMDPTYPKEFNNNPSGCYDTGENLPPAVSHDSRLEEDYYYVENIFGWLRFCLLMPQNSSNYGHTRYQYNYLTSFEGNPMHIIKAAELRLIQAECEYRLGNYEQAANIINSGERITRGNLPPVDMTDPEAIAKAIFYEYSIELDNGGLAVNWSYMRRWDRLQSGRATHFPIPASELAIINESTYTFGGVENAGQPGTASGSNSWKND